MEDLQASIRAVVKELFDVGIEPLLTRPEEQFGDYTTNVALQLAAKLGKPPREVAETISAKIVSPDIIKTEVAGPGFINFALSDAALLRATEAQPAPPFAGQKVVIETNNPNPFKDIHIGHAFNSIVADTIANLVEIGGAEVRRVSYHGDVGLHVGKSLWAILNEYGEEAPQKLAELGPENAPEKMREWYARGAGMYEEEPSVRDSIEDLARQSFHPEGLVKEVYDLCKAYSFAYFDQVFSQLGSKPVERRYLESETDAAGKQIVEQHIGGVFEESEGAVVFKGEVHDPSLHTRVFISRHHTTLYEARDLGLIQLKATDYQADKSYMVTAAEQKDYFRVVLKAAALALPDIKTATINISTGTVKLTTGKMSSRTGQVVTVEWLLDQIGQGVRQLTTDTNTVQDSIVAAIRYSMLKSRLDGDIVFDVAQSVSLEGNTGPYLQYAHARACSILAKASATDVAAALDNLQADERSLVRKISEYPEVVELATSELMPHHICTYLYELAQTFNRFYEKNRVIGDPRETQRLQLVQSYANILKKGLDLLNIPAPEHM